MTTVRSEETPVPAPVAGTAVEVCPAVAAEEAIMLDVRVEPFGPAAERAVALACNGSALARDGDAPLGRPAASGELAGGEAALAALVHASALALDETDLHLTVRRR